MKNRKIIMLYALLYGITMSQYGYAYNPHPPKLTVVIVIDQFAHHYINKLYSQFKHGFKYLFDTGIVFTNAHMPHGQPGTATGHAALNTGTYAKDHGFISNGWVAADGKKVACDDDESLESRVINPCIPGATYNYSKSAKQLMVDGLSDQCALQSTPISAFNVFSISGKSRSAIATASKLGKAIWFDNQSGLFTSSKAYFDTLPTWIENFNKVSTINKQGSIVWHRMYQKKPHAYSFFDIDFYGYARKKDSMLDRALPVPDLAHEKNHYHFFERTPQANKNILNLAEVCIKNNVSRKTNDRLLLWVCLSPLDKLAHQYGPHSIEVIDMLYHLDKQLQKFIRSTIKAVGKHQVVFALTADHGTMPIPEILQNKNFSLAKRVDQQQFIQPINEQLYQEYGISDMIQGLRGNEITLNKAIKSELSKNELRTLLNKIKQYAQQSPLIKNAWTKEELKHLATHPQSIEDNLKNQLFKDRSGDVVIQAYPYTFFTHWAEGTSHKTPYDYDTHVPLILLQRGKFERKYVRQKVTTLQLANSLAEILNIPKPSSSTAEVLPELFDPEYQ